MRKLIFTLLILLSTFWVQAQTCVWSENFDGASVNMTSGGSPGWSIDQTYTVSSPSSYRGQYNASGITLTSPSIDLTGLNFVKLEFDQICKIEFIDTARVEVSIGGGAWQKVSVNNGSIYLGPSLSFSTNGEKFAESSYFDWQPGQTNPPQNSWWKREVFDVSAVAGNQSDVRFRFVVIDNGNGIAGRYGWLLDNVCVIGAPCELNPNTFSFTGYPYYQGNIYTAPPSFDIYADLIDPSGVAFAELYWTVNSDPTVYQFGGMVDFGNNQWVGQITSPVNIDDTICWWIESIDNSGCLNVARWPAAGCVQFILKGGISYPYCDNFDIQNPPFTDSIGTGTDNWELGAHFSLGSHSAPNVWGIGLLDGVYDNDAEAYVTSPLLDFTTLTAANLSFWQNYDTEATWDGVRMEYSLDDGITWSLLGTGSDVAPDPYGVNWYTDDELNSSLTNGWEGNSGGWIESRYKLGFVPGLMGANTVRFRYVFTSDPSVTGTGYAIDDWCITIPPGFDAGVTAFVAPSCNAGLPEGDPLAITVNIENFGLNTLSGFDVAYSINGGAPVLTPFPGNLDPNTTAPITLTTGVVPSGAFDVCVWTIVAGDTSNVNDTICCSFAGIPTLVPTYCDDFEGGNIGWSASNSATGNAGTIWELGLPAYNATSSANSGVNAWDINLNSAYTNQAESYLFSPYFDVSTIATGRLEFWMNFNCENSWDGTRLEYTLDNGTTWNTLGNGPGTNNVPFPAPAGTDPCGTNWYNDGELNSSLSPAWCGNSNGWIKASYKMCCATGFFGNPVPVQFRFVYTSDFSVITDGFSIDDFCFYAVNGDDVGVSAILSPVGGVPSGTPQVVTLTIENYGSTTLTSVPVNYSINNGPVVSFLWTGNLLACGTATVTMPSSTFTQGVNNIVAYTTLATDNNLNNDTTSIAVVGQPTLVPTYSNNYTDDFENGNIGWAPSSAPGSGNNAWEFGLPNFGQTTGARSPITAWDVNLQDAVGANAICYLSTPYFDLTNAIQASFRFWQNRNINAFGDEFYVEYDINNQNTWQRLGSPTSTGTTNWYNGVGNFWDDLTAGWIQSEYENFTAETGNPSLIQFRFVLETGFGTRDGISIDDFQIFVPIPLSVSPTAVLTSIPNQLIFPGQQITFATPVLNNGINIVFNHNITLEIDGSIVTSSPINYTPTGLAPDSIKTVNFPTTWTAIPGFHEVCVWTDSPNGSLDLTQFDDTVCTTVLVFDSVTTNQLPYCNSFESGTQWVTVNALSYANKSIWELGTPQKAFINSAHTGSKAWITVLDNDYANNDSSGLFSDALRVEANKCYKVSYWTSYRSEFGSDGGTLDYSTDYGTTWNRMDYSNTPNIFLFGPKTNYTYVTTLDPNDPGSRGFTGYQNQWMKTEKVIRPGVDGQVIIRWRFASDYSTRDEGWAIDDFCFEDLGACTPLGITEVPDNNLALSQNYPNPTNSMTAVEYILPEAGQVNIVLYDILGQKVADIENAAKGSGLHKVEFSTTNLAPGMYVYTLRFNNMQVSKRMTVTH